MMHPWVAIAVFFLSSIAMAQQPGSGLPTWLEEKTGIEFVHVPKGCFQMGAAASVRPKADFIWDHLGYKGLVSDDEVPRHEVCVDAFWIGRTEVTAQAWAQVMGQRPAFGNGSEPAAGLSWHDAEIFAKRLTEFSGFPSRFALPTEAQWEYACLAGSKDGPMPEMGKTVPDAWYSAWSRKDGQQAFEPMPVGRLGANAWGLFDMLGNVWEWTADGYRADAYRHHKLFNPVIVPNAVTGASRVIRGASHRSEYLQVRCSVRSSLDADAGSRQLGLRLVRTSEKP